ncbi:OmpP1/FadL family transporter [Thiomicrospira pelophila]|uniref:OmpP1/FadL family transporter n=1 Tax=Thiomicrospira pelophila TaxID=934 RepID=UPI0004A75E84|nr:outer membrane protein transport protein [Thiomicrospira pelophila]
MKKTKIALAITAAVMVSQPVLATNGDHLIGLGAQARALGGTGAAAFFGSENALTNPALIGKMQGTEFAIGGTLFKPNVKAETDVASQTGPVSQTSDADTNIIPEVSMATRINENLVFGLGIYGSAGMGVDYRDNGGATDGMGLFNGYSNLQIMKFAPTLAYNTEQYGIGFAPVIQYGSLDINLKQYDTNGTPLNPADDVTHNVGNGMSTDLGYGFNLGGYFDISPELTIGLAYQSAIAMKYKDQITTAADGFNLPAGTFSDDLEQPAELKIGVAYNMGNMMYTADFKQIAWGQAKGYKDFNWDDQNVFALGAKYSGNGYWAGVGINHAEDPIKEVDDATASAQANGLAQATNIFNNHFFPGIVETHFTIGGGYELTNRMTLEGAVVYASEVSKTVNTGYLSQQATADATTHEVTHSQIGYTVSLRMNF